MTNVIVAFAKENDARNFKSILVRKGFEVAAVCTSGAQALSAMEDLGNGVIVCGYRLSDMVYGELASDLPSYFQMLLVASRSKMEDVELPENVIFLETPLQPDNLVSTLNLMLEGVSVRRKKARESTRDKNRTEEQKETIRKAKDLLMERHHMSEPEAHRYLQKCSMDSGTGIVEAAEMVISLTSI